MLIPALWVSAWSFRRLGASAIGAVIAGMVAGCVLLIALSAIVARDEDPLQPELNATEAAAVARSETVLLCRRRGGEARWCDGYSPALIDRTCDQTWFIILFSGDGRKVWRVFIGRRGAFDGLSGEDDPSPGELERWAKRSHGTPLVSEGLEYCKP